MFFPLLILGTEAPVQSNPSTHPGSAAAAATEAWGTGVAEGRNCLTKAGLIFHPQRTQKGGTQRRSARIRKGELKESYFTLGSEKLT